MDVPAAAKLFKRHLRGDNDNVIAITSPFEGMGKSTLLIHLCKAIDKDWDMDNQLLINPDVKGLKRLILGEDKTGKGKLPQYSAIGLDEAISIVYKLDWHKPETQFINKLFAKARKENLAYIFAMPRFRDFTEFFRNHKIRIWIHLIDRGSGVAFMKDDGATLQDPWFLKESEKIWIKKIKSIVGTSNERKASVYKRFRNFLCFIEFPDLDGTTKEEYIKLRDQFKYSDVNFEKKRNEEEWNDAKLILQTPSLRGRKGNIVTERVEAFFGIGCKKAARRTAIAEMLEEEADTKSNHNIL